MDTDLERSSKKTATMADDRLSSLPDRILSNILSRLSSNAAVATGVLSQRWRGLWTTVTVLDFSFYSRRQLSLDVPRFFTIVDDVLRQLTSRYISKFSISVDADFMFDDEFDNCKSKVESWFDQLCDRVVESLDIDWKCDDLRVLIPPRVFRNTNLVGLDLRYCFDCKLPKEITLPSLKKLHIVLDHHDEELIRRLLTSCPLLEDLELRVNDDYSCDYMPEESENDDVLVVVPSPNLKKLSVGFSAKRVKVMVNAPNLEYFEIYEEDISRYCFTKHPDSLEDVEIGGEICRVEDVPMYEDHILGLVIVIASARCIKLACGFTRALSYLGDEIFPMFCNLHSLVICLENIENSKVVFDFLHSSPNLECLVVHDENDGDGLEAAIWQTPNSVPLCLLSQVKVISVQNIEGSEHYFNMIKYILRNAAVIELFRVIICSSTEEKEVAICKELEFAEELFTCPRSSPTCEIQFLGEHLKVSGEGIRIGKLDCRNICSWEL